MPTFTYKALDKSGQEITGTVDSENRQAAIRELQQKGYIPIQIIEQGKEKTIPLPTKTITSTIKKAKKIKPSVLLTFIQQLSTLLTAGVPLLDSLNIISEQTTDPALKFALDDTISNIRKGDSFADALRKQNPAFPATMVSIIAAGEASGSLPQVLTRYGQFLERQENLVKRTRTMMIYPAFVISFAIIIVMGIMILILPKFQSFFSEQKIPIPGITKFLINTSNFLTGKASWFILPLSIIGIAVSIRLAIRSKKGREIWDSIKLKIPLIGNLIFNSILAQFSITLSTLIGGGLPVVDALRVVKGTVSSNIIANEIDRIIHEIERGKPIAPTMKEKDVFPAMMIQMVKVGEETGKLEKLLADIGNYYDRETEISASRIIALMEPLVVIIMGLSIGVMVISIVLPIFSMSRAIRM
jgi:type IV pilus assembly protein PilC